MIQNIEFVVMVFGLAVAVFSAFIFAGEFILNLIGLIKKLKSRFSRWSSWRKHNGSNDIHKLLVLLGFVKSQSFEFTCTKEEAEEIIRTYRIGLRASDIMSVEPSYREENENVTRLTEELMEAYPEWFREE